MPVKSAGLLLYRFHNSQLQVLLVHPGGPFWKNKDAGAWSLPKGEFAEDEKALTAAIRETKEEIGLEVKGDFIDLSSVRMKSGKIIYAWAVETDFDPAQLESNTFEMEWPPKSGKTQAFPEIDKAEWFTPEEANVKLNETQRQFLQRLLDKINSEHI
jgi:predicted NUDIX family NTP pyrophosphohydrolase